MKIIFNSHESLNTEHDENFIGDFQMSIDSPLNEIPDSFKKEYQKQMDLYKENIFKIKKINKENKLILNEIKTNFKKFIEKEYPEYFI